MGRGDNLRRPRDIQFGTKFGRLSFRRSFTKTMPYGIVKMGEFECSCDGKTHVATLSPVVNGRVKSCGCLRNEAGARSLTRYNKSLATHGMSKTPLHIKWGSMRQRCHDANHQGFPRYGGRGIRVCDEWDTSFLAFREWAISSGWTDGCELSIERVDVNGHYCPENCKLIPMSEQAANQTQNRKLTAFGETKNVADWARDSRCAVKKQTLYKRLCYGFSEEDAIALPIQRNRKHEAFGEAKTLREWSSDPRCAVELELLKERVYRGWDAEKAMMLQVGPTSSKKNK